MKLTEAQRRAIQWFADGHARSAYRARSSRATLEALYRRGLLSKRVHKGAIFSPQTAIEYCITPAGRAALEAEE